MNDPQMMARRLRRHPLFDRLVRDRVGRLGSNVSTIRLDAARPDDVLFGDLVRVYWTHDYTFCLRVVLPPHYDFDDACKGAPPEAKPVNRVDARQFRAVGRLRDRRYVYFSLRYLLYHGPGESKTPVLHPMPSDFCIVGLDPALFLATVRRSLTISDEVIERVRRMILGESS